MSIDSYRRQFGDRAGFALELSLAPAPYGSATDWGGVSIWANGRCLTQAVSDEGAVTEAIQTELTPVLEWLSVSAVRLINEEPFPHRAREVGDASDWFVATEQAPAMLDEVGEQRWFDARSEWRRYHALRQASPAVAFPNVVLRRFGDEVEVSWDNERWGSPRPTLRFVEQRGAALVPAADVAEALRDALLEMARELDLPDIATATRLNAGRSQWRWLIHEPTADLIRKELPSVADRLDRRTTKARRGLYVPHQPETWLLRQAGPVTLSELRGILSTQGRVGDQPLSEDLRAAVRGTRPDPSEPWREGYERALELRERMGWGANPLPDLARWLRRKGGRTEQIVLPRAIDLVCQRTDDGRAGVVLNRQGADIRREIGVATGLGHLLMDRASVSLGGEYEHWPSGARARAFGVMLTLPLEGLKERLARFDRIDARAVRDVMNHFGAGPYATTFHLVNCGFVDESQRLPLLQALSS
ncbi:MAG: hypothetical protein AB7S26_31235 [Sandaracinaceae bacterium]